VKKQKFDHASFVKAGFSFLFLISEKVVSFFQIKLKELRSLEERCNFFFLKFKEYIFFSSNLSFLYVCTKFFRKKSKDFFFEEREKKR
jgi:hypothetical protein